MALAHLFIHLFYHKIYKIVVGRGLLLFNVAPEKGKIRINPDPNTETDPNPDTRVYPWHSKVRNADELPRLLLLLLLLEEPRLLNYLKDKCATRTHFPPFNTLPPPSLHQRPVQG